jgi:RHS repeat-associated protein
MKKLIYTLAFVFVSQLVLAQTTTENYVKSTSYKEPVQNQTQIDALADDDKIESITYFDGLGRAVQSVAPRAGGNKETIYSHMNYDQFGREVFSYLPVPSSSELPTNSQFDFYNDSQLPLDDKINDYYSSKFPEDQLTSTTINAYSQTRFEFSPLNRVIEQGAPGKDWLINETSDSDHTIKFEYNSNTVDEVERYTVIFPTLNPEEPQLFYDGYYQPNELYKTITKDENWQPSQTNIKAHTTEEFKNKYGQVILKRTYDSQGIKHDTQYVYDDFGNLTYVLSPKGSDLVLTSNRYISYTAQTNHLPFVPNNKYGNPVTGGSGTVDMSIDAINKTITVDFSLSFNASINLNNGGVFLFATGMPNMIIGNISPNGSNYIVSIQDGYLFIAGSGNVTSVNEILVADIPYSWVQSHILDDLCYQYHYDKKNRLIEKKIPQKGWEYIVYNNLDQPVLTQDANLKANHDKWLFTKYDALGRVVYTGLYNQNSFALPPNSTNEGRKQLQATLDGAITMFESSLSSSITIDNTQIFYSNLSFPKVDIMELYTINYYDSYNTNLSNTFSNPTTVFGQNVTTNTHRLPTGSLTRVLDTNDWITSVNYYDNKGQAIFTGSENDYLHTTDTFKTEFDFTGKVLKTESSHIKDSNTAIIVTDRFTYDHANRLLTQKQQITGQSEQLIVKNSYDELGQLITKDVGGIEAAPLQTVDYKYNIRGWLKSINDLSSIGNDLFAFNINYNDTSLGQSNSKLYNGNISETIWKTVNDISNTTTRGYAYEYDALNRLESANMSINTGAGFGLASGYHVNGLQYDKNGNIVDLQRTGATSIFDDLTYIYDGNQLSIVNDAITNQQTEGFIDGNTSGNDYEYDDNGNMIEDKNKGIIDVDYNHLNLPILVDFGSNNQIEYVYDATGVKLEKKVTDNSAVTSTFYASNFIYEETSAGEELKFFSHPEGYVEPDNLGNYNYIYQYKDHLGNIRLSYSDPNQSYESLINSAFYEEYDGWTHAGGAANGSIEIENNRLRVNVKNQWNGVYIEVGDNFSVGDQVELHIDIDKGNTQDLRIFYSERDASDNHLAWYMLNSNAQTGSYTFNHTIVAGTRLQLKLDKSNTNLGVETHFYIDNVYAKNGELEIIEENNYYPFGLKHKGYNNVVNGTHHPYTFNGKEEQEELGLNWHDFGFRNYDASLGRWMNIDNLAEKYYNYSPYIYTANNPIYYIDPDGQQIIIHYQDEDGNDQQHIYEYGGKYDGDNQFIKDVYASFNHLIDNDADTTGLIKKLAGDELGDINVLQNTKENNKYFGNDKMATYFNSETNTVIWDPEIGVSQEQNSVWDWITGDGYEHEALVSPAEALLHELGHGESSLEDPEQHKKDSNTPFTNGWDNKEEFDVIRKIENPAGKKLKRDRVRDAHRGTPYRTVSPTSVKPKEKKKS